MIMTFDATKNTGQTTSKAGIFVYARHGRELLGLKSLIIVPVLSEELSINYYLKASKGVTVK